MGTVPRTLGDDVLAAFERACRDGELEVAEHLLRAIETMDRSGNDEDRMEHAYLGLKSLPFRQ